MSEIFEGVTFEMSNVLSYRNKMTQQMVAQVLKEIEQILKDNNISKSGSTVTATHSIEHDNGQTLLDLEILVPLSKKIDVPRGYVFKPQFRIRNAMKVRHNGNPNGLQDSVNELMAYMAQKKLTPITVGYNVTIKEATNQFDVDDMIVDVYVGVSDNIL